MLRKVMSLVRQVASRVAGAGDPVSSSFDLWPLSALSTETGREALQIAEGAVARGDTPMQSRSAGKPT